MEKCVGEKVEGTPLRHIQVHEAELDTPKCTEKVGRSAHGATFHHLSAILANR